MLRTNQVDEIYIVSLATDYCVKYTVLEAISLGYKTHLITEGCKGINLNDVEKAICEMRKAGAIIQ